MSSKLSNELKNCNDDQYIICVTIRTIIQRQIIENNIKQLSEHINAEISMQSIISFFIKKTIKINKCRQIKSKFSLFDGPYVPKISILDYIKRFIKYTKIDEKILLVTLIYIDRYSIITLTPITHLNIHRLFSIAFVIANKYINDRLYDNKLYARISGLSLIELNKLEWIFLKNIKINLFIKREIYDMYEVPITFLKKHFTINN